MLGDSGADSRRRRRGGSRWKGKEGAHCDPQERGSVVRSVQVMAQRTTAWSSTSHNKCTRN